MAVSNAGRLMVDLEGSIWNEDLKKFRVEKGQAYCIHFVGLCKGQGQNCESDIDVTELISLAEFRVMLKDKGRWR